MIQKEKLEMFRKALQETDEMILEAVIKAGLMTEEQQKLPKEEQIQIALQ
ncbi:MAG: hypothetical protein GX840_01540, partial [Bacteroidales bacterium]|nr:hypothetical protein [Bacteroidales bacterium]